MSTPTPPPPGGAPPGGPPSGPRPPAPGPWPVPARPYPESSQGVLAFVLGVLSVISVPLLGPVAWWLGLADQRAVDAGRRDPSGRGAAVAGYVLGIVGTVFLGLGLLVLLAVVGFALVGLLIAVPVAVHSDSGPRGFAEYGVESGAGDADQRARWLEAGPRDAATDASSGRQDRCDLLPWLEGQFSTGMTTDEVTAAVGEADSVRDRDGGEVWLWNLGPCSFLDYDTYELTFEGGVLVNWQYRQG